MTFLDNNIIISNECQEKLGRIDERIKLKEQLKFSIEQVLLNSRHLGLESKQFERFEDCGKFISLSKESGKIKKANFCKLRLCPVCNFIKSSVTWHTIKNCVELIKEEHENCQFIFMTLTVRNCAGEELSETIDNLLEGFHRLTNRKTWIRSILGCIRGLEITYNEKKKTYHPHIHILCAVPADYFVAEKNKYISIEQLRQWWTESARLDYFVQVDISAIKQTDSAIAEVAKYAIKMSDILKEGDSFDRIVATQNVYDFTYRRRLIACLGCFKDAMKKLNIKNIDEIDMEEITDEECINLLWSRKGYKEIKCQSKFLTI